MLFRSRAERIMRSTARLEDDRALCDKLRAFPSVVIGTWAPQPDDHVVIEGTQGYGLGLHTKHYPQCTSSDCRAIDFLAMAGISPWGHIVEVWAVARMFPIRVAGNSGYLKGETTWEALGLPPEYTTVTQKVRRVGEWDPVLVAEAVRANGGAPHVRLALTMTDQRWPDLRDVNTSSQARHVMDSQTKLEMDEWIHRVERDTRAQVAMITTGPRTGFFL